jgi:hypothetical protein
VLLAAALLCCAVASGCVRVDAERREHLDDVEIATRFASKLLSASDGEVCAHAARRVSIARLSARASSAVGLRKTCTFWCTIRGLVGATP